MPDPDNKSPEQYGSQEAIDIVKMESDKQVALVQQKLDAIGGNFKHELYVKLYDYYKAGAERAANNGKLDKKEFERYKDEMLKKTDEILKQYVPTEEQIETKKREVEAAKEAAKEGIGGKEADLKLGEIPKELPENTPAEKVQEKLQDYANLSQAFNSEVQVKLGELNGFYGKLQEYEQYRTQHRAAYTWDKISGIVGTSDDDNKVQELQRAADALKGAVRKKKNELADKRKELDKYGKSIQSVLAKKKADLIKARDAEVKRLEEDRGKVGADMKEKEARYKELKAQEEALADKKNALVKSRDELEKLRQADDSPQNMTAKIEKKKDAVEKAFDAESEKEKVLNGLLTQPGITDEQKQLIETALKEIGDRKKRAGDGKSLLGKNLEKSKGADAALNDAERAVEGDLSTVDGTLEKFVYPTIQSLDENLIMLKTYKDQFSDCEEGIRDRFEQGIEVIGGIQKQTDEFVLQASLSNSMSMNVMEKASEQLESLVVDKQGAFGAAWDGFKELFQGSVGLILSVPGGWASDLGKWIMHKGTDAQDGYRSMDSGWKYAVAVPAEIFGLGTGIIGGAWEIVGGVLTALGKPLDTLEGLGLLISINKRTGEIGDFSTAGSAWKELGKSLISYEEFEKGHVSTGVGKSAVLIASFFVGAGEASAAAKTASAGSKLARLAKLEQVAAAGGKVGRFTGRMVEATTYFKIFGKELWHAPGFLTRGGDVMRGANLGKASEGALQAVRAVEAAETTAAMAGKGGKAVQAAESVERAAMAAKNMKWAEAESLAKYADEAKQAAKTPAQIERAERMAAKAEAVAKEAEAATKAADMATEAAAKMKLAQKAIDEASLAEEAIGKGDAAGRTAREAEAAAKGTKAADALEEAIKAAEAAETAAGAMGNSSPALALARSMLRAMPGGKDALTRFRMAEGGGAKTLAVMRSAVEVPARTVVEGARLTYHAAKLIMYELPLGALRGAGRFMKALPQIGKAIFMQGVPEFALRLQRVSKAMRVMEKEADGLAGLRQTFVDKVTSRGEVMENILKDIRSDSALARKYNFTEAEWQKIAETISKDPWLDDLAGAHPDLAKVVENKALSHFLTIDAESAAAMMRINDALATIMDFGAKDEKVMMILDKIFKKGWFPDAVKAANAEKVAAEAAAAKTAEAAKAARPTPYENANLTQESLRLHPTNTTVAYGTKTEGHWIEVTKLENGKFRIARVEESKLAEVMDDVDNIKITDTGNGKNTLTWDHGGKPREYGNISEVFKPQKYSGELAAEAKVAAAAEEAAAGAAEATAAAGAAEATAAAALEKAVTEAAAEGSKALAVGRYIRGKLDGAKKLYTDFKAKPPPAVRGEIKKILKQNAAIIASIPTLEKIAPNLPIVTMFEEIENRIAHIEAMGELPPSIELPEDLDEMIRKGAAKKAGDFS